jgi:alkylated DNA repair protein (DNA oxidative demethylase)
VTQLPKLSMKGLGYRPQALEEPAQRSLLAWVADTLEAAPFFTPRMPRTGKPFSVAMTNAGPLGWMADKEGGYRYEPRHPETGRPWPEISPILLELWAETTGYPHPPEACLINYYRPGAKMGLHQDKDEQDFDAPVLSVSLGDTAVFRIAEQRSGPSRSMKLASGDVLVMGGAARLSFHGIDRVLGGSSRLLGPPLFPEGGRINLTLRRVTKPG